MSDCRTISCPVCKHGIPETFVEQKCPRCQTIIESKMICGSCHSCGSNLTNEPYKKDNFISKLLNIFQTSTKN
jgi:C4-type Zn-finger protein